MSASRERKERASRPAAQPVKKEKKKVSEGLILAISVILVLVAVFGTVLTIRYCQSNQTVMTIGDKELKVKEFNYFFNQTANNFGNYASYVGIDTSKPIDQQNVGSENTAMMSMLGMDIDCLEAYKQEDGSYDITWAGYFAELAKNTAAQTYAMYQAAQAEGYEASEEVATAINNEMANVSIYSQIYGMSADDFIAAQYGRGCNEENYKEHLTVSYTASEFASKYEYSAAEIDTKYDAEKADFDVAAYMLYTARAEDFEAEEETAEEGETTETTETTENTETTETEEKKVSEEAIAKAKEAAEKMVKEFNVDEEGVSVYADHTQATAKSYSTEEAAKWIFETAKAGDVKLFENKDTNTYYVIKVLGNDVNYQTVNALQIFIPKDAEEGTEEVDHTGHDHAPDEIPEAEQIAAMTAEEKLEAVKNGLAIKVTEEKFRELAEKYSDGTHAVDLEEASYSYISGNISGKALLWAMEEHEVGDYEVFETSSGTYVVYYNGLGETYRNLSVNSKLVSEWIEKLTKEAVEKANFDLEAAMNGSVGLTFTQQNQG